MPVGIESAHRFGDLLWNAPLIREIQRKYDDDILVAARPNFKDALYNLPWINRIVEIRQMGQGIEKLKSLGCKPVFQITQNIKFFEFKMNDPQHSLADTPLWTGRQLGLKDFDQRPIFIPTATEKSKTEAMIQPRPTIAIESVYNSAQSWADEKAIQLIIDKHAKTHRILWLSNRGAPDIDCVDDMLRFTRREVIMCLRACDIFFSVGSGFFCAALALPDAWQPQRTICLWTDSLYKYEEPLKKHKWIRNLDWVHNHNELMRCLSQ